MREMLLAATLLPGSTSVWTDGIYTWGGNQWCAEPGLDPSGCIEWSGAAPDIGGCEYWVLSGLPDPPTNLTVQ